MLDSTELFAGHRLPEVLGGVTRYAEHPHSGVYPTSNQPQGWSASAIVLVVHALLGLQPVAPLGLLFVNSQLPSWMPDLRLEGLRVGAARIDIEFRRDRSGQTSYRVTSREGHLRVMRQPPPQQPGVSAGRRARAGLGSLLPTRRH